MKYNFTLFQLKIIMFVIGISGSRCVGKDTFFNMLYRLNNRFKRYAFADALKYDLHPLIYTQFHVDLFNVGPYEKEIIRPIMISYGTAWRTIDKNHWVKKVDNQIQNEHVYDSTIVPVITDVRYDNELDFLREKYGEKFLHIHITRINSPDPTLEEMTSISTIQHLADVNVKWGNNDDQEMLNIVKKVYEKYNHYMFKNE